MAQSSDGGELGEIGFGAWCGFWAQLVVLGLLAIVGAFFASADAEPGDYACGLILAVAATALAFMRLKSRLDGVTPAGWGDTLLVDDMANLVLAIIVFAVLGLGGLIVAAGSGYGGLHDGGVALFVVSAIGVFLSMKRVFDNRDRTH